MARAIRTEYLQTASVSHPQMHSPYEGVAILKEKYGILWDEVRGLDAERMRAAVVRRQRLPSALRSTPALQPRRIRASGRVVVRPGIRDARRKLRPSTAGKEACPRRIAEARRLDDLVASRDTDTPANLSRGVVPGL
jgi:hypothetical protein